MQVFVVGQFGRDLHGRMHFSVPDTVELKDKNGSNYLVSIHVVCFALISRFVSLKLSEGSLLVTHLFSFINSLNSQKFHTTAITICSSDTFKCYHKRKTMLLDLIASQFVEL